MGQLASSIGDGRCPGERSLLLSLNIAKIGQISQNNGDSMKTPLRANETFKMQTFAFQDFRVKRRAEPM
jgi:hypothetical protein